MELREEPRRYIRSQSSIMSPLSPVSPTKAMTFASEEEEEPPAYINDYRTRNQPPWTRVTRDNSWRNLNEIPSVRSPSPALSSEFSPPQKEMPLRPNRREDVEFGKEDISSPSQVLLPVFVSKKPTRKKSSGGNSAKSWLKNIKSPIDMMQ